MTLGGVYQNSAFQIAAQGKQEYADSGTALSRTSPRGALLLSPVSVARRYSEIPLKKERISSTRSGWRGDSFSEGRDLGKSPPAVAWTPSARPSPYPRRPRSRTSGRRRSGHGRSSGGSRWPPRGDPHRALGDRALGGFRSAPGSLEGPGVVADAAGDIGHRVPGGVTGGVAGGDAGGMAGAWSAPAAGQEFSI